MSPVRTRLAVTTAAAVLVWAAIAPAALSQAGGAYLCRVRWEEQTYGGDTLATTGVIELTRTAPQGDGSIVYMGQGQADIVFTPGGGCTATRGHNVSVTMMGIVSSDDGETAEVDIGAFMDDTFTVAVACPYAQNSAMDVGVSTPPTLTMRLQDGASASYDESTRHSFGTVGGQRGTVTLEYCRPG